MKRVFFAEVRNTIERAFLGAKVAPWEAKQLAQIMAESSLDGVYSHGVNRVARIIQFIEKGWVLPAMRPLLEQKFSAIESYNGQLGSGILNGLFATERAVELAHEFGIGLVALNNTNHWMRGGTYGWHAAHKNCLLIAWSNTDPCMPAWGAVNCNIGNNPFVMAVPRADGAHIVLDMAMSQYSLGSIKNARLAGEELEFDGGYDQKGKLSKHPADIEASRRFLPMGLWKGSAFAIVLDLFASLLSNGLSTAALSKTGRTDCTACCQVYIAFDTHKIHSGEDIEAKVLESITHLKETSSPEDFKEILYPGELALRHRVENTGLGIPVDETVWDELCQLAALAP